MALLLCPQCGVRPAAEYRPLNGAKAAAGDTWFHWAGCGGVVTTGETAAPMLARRSVAAPAERPSRPRRDLHRPTPAVLEPATQPVAEAVAAPAEPVAVTEPVEPAGPAAPAESVAVAAPARRAGEPPFPAAAMAEPAGLADAAPELPREDPAAVRAELAEKPPPPPPLPFTFASRGTQLSTGAGDRFAAANRRGAVGIARRQSAPHAAEADAGAARTIDAGRRSHAGATPAIPVGRRPARLASVRLFARDPECGDVDASDHLDLAEFEPVDTALGATASAPVGTESAPAEIAPTTVQGDQ